MKIPETSANIGAYYGNEENGQWQPNGVIIDSGVGGGVVGSGDAGVHRPQMYPVHVRPHIAGGYVVPAYYAGGGAAFAAGHAPPAPPAPQDDFADYMWMEHEEEFDKQVMQQLEEEALMEQCIEAMLEDEQRELRQQRPHNGHHRHCPASSNGAPISQVSLEEAVSRSTLNPLAAEFVPTRRPPQPQETEQSREDREPSETSLERSEASPLVRLSAGDASAAMDCLDTAVCPTEMAEPVPTEPPTTSTNAAPSSPPEPETPEVSAAQIIPDKPRPRKEVKSHKPVVTKTEAKRKPVVVKSETKIEKVDTKEEVREERREEKEVDSSKPHASQPSTEEPPQSQSQSQSGPKPINYAAAARANKAKKPVTPAPAPAQPAEKPVNKSVTEKSSVTRVVEKSSVTKVVEKTSSTKISDKTMPKAVEKAPARSETKVDKKAKPIQRKNSTK